VSKKAGVDSKPLGTCLVKFPGVHLTYRRSTVGILEEWQSSVPGKLRLPVANTVITGNVTVGRLGTEKPSRG
jgi:hypothetical protein